MRKNVAMQSLQILYTFVVRAEIATTFGPKMVAISARNTKVGYTKFANFALLYFSHFATFRMPLPNFVILLILVCSF
jgi:hypothetical protein